MKIIFAFTLIAISLVSMHENSDMDKSLVASALIIAIAICDKKEAK